MTTALQTGMKVRNKRRMKLEVRLQLRVPLPVASEILLGDDVMHHHAEPHHDYRLYILEATILYNAFKPLNILYQLLDGSISYYEYIFSFDTAQFYSYLYCSSSVTKPQNATSGSGLENLLAESQVNHHQKNNHV